MSLLNIWRIKRKLKLTHDLFNLTFNNKDQLVILGTSNSINNISAKEWNEINKATTVGVNYFLFNDFVPDIIQLEIKQGEDKDYFDNLIKILKSRETAYDNSILLIKSNYDRSNQDLKKKIAFLKLIPDRLKKNLRFCVDFPIPAITLKHYKTALRIINFCGLFKRENLFFTPHLRASIGLTTALGFKYNFTEIIYGGVDLNHRKTFYDSELLHKNYGIVLNQKEIGGPHLTNDPSYSKITIVEVLLLLKNELKAPNIFSVLSNKSALRKIMPLKKF